MTTTFGRKISKPKVEAGIPMTTEGRNARDVRQKGRKENL
jgi:hypothetical protein